ncbi:MAG: thioredoxin domain-containing protein [Lawsonibacter sp.]|nr:thioredoxin domain-containing protein [Lawsonibacter sp.]
MATIRCKQPNRLIKEQSPYLLQHAYNPVDWYPWGKEALEKAKRENKPVFVSIGYSTCHWCHVMEMESFENETVAELLNQSFVSIKVDREERPDIDHIYMRVCQAFTGSGGWPTSIFMTAEQKPFFAGTYFPSENFYSLLYTIQKKWVEDQSALLRQGTKLAAALQHPIHAEPTPAAAPINAAVSVLRQTFDEKFGGFGYAPKFPTPHLLFLLLYTAPDIAERTLLQMYRGGIFDQIGYGFSRYSTDRFWLVPHFEKMLYDNALLATAYLMGYEVTGKEPFRTVAEQILLFLDRELKTPEGGFFSAQDADSGGIEGNYYLFTPEELIQLLGEADGRRFNDYFGITQNGNYEGKNIPNLLHNPKFDPSISRLLPKVYEYRKARMPLQTDHKLLTAWNALALAAYANAYRILGTEEFLHTARNTFEFMERNLTDRETVYAGMTGGVRGGRGFLDDYAFYIYALLCLHQATQDKHYQDRAHNLLQNAISEYFDHENGGFFFSGKGNETLIFNPKETYDGAIPSGNSVMAYNLTRLYVLTHEDTLYSVLKKQEAFLNAAAAESPSGLGFYLYSMLPTKDIVCVLKDPSELNRIRIKSNWVFQVTDDPAYPMHRDKTTFYVCGNNTCLPPSNELPE